MADVQRSLRKFIDADAPFCFAVSLVELEEADDLSADSFENGRLNLAELCGEDACHDGFNVLAMAK